MCITIGKGVGTRRSSRCAHAAGGSFSPPELAKLYKFPAGADGTGQCIAIIELGGGFRAADIRAYFQKLGLPVPAVTAVRVDGGRSLPSTPDSDDGIASENDAVASFGPLLLTTIVYDTWPPGVAVVALSVLVTVTFTSTDPKVQINFSEATHNAPALEDGAGNVTIAQLSADFGDDNAPIVENTHRAELGLRQVAVGGVPLQVFLKKHYAVAASVQCLRQSAKGCGVTIPPC